MTIAPRFNAGLANKNPSHTFARSAASPSEHLSPRPIIPKPPIFGSKPAEIHPAMAQRIKYFSANRFAILFVTAVLIFGAAVVVLVSQNFIHSGTTPGNGCINNLRQLDGAKEQWQLELHKSTNDVPTWDDIRPYVGRGAEGTLPTCPMGGKYTLHKLGQKPTCSCPGHVLRD
jgi:hypothetical protein